MNKLALKLLDMVGDYVDDRDGKLRIGDLVYVKPTGKFNMVCGFDPFINTIELSTGEIHAGISGYCYNRNIIRLPRCLNSSMLSSDIHCDTKEIILRLKGFSDRALLKVLAARWGMEVPE